MGCSRAAAEWLGNLKDACVAHRDAWPVLNNDVLLISCTKIVFRLLQSPCAGWRMHVLPTAGLHTELCPKHGTLLMFTQTLRCMQAAAEALGELEDVKEQLSSEQVARKAALQALQALQSQAAQLQQDKAALQSQVAQLQTDNGALQGQQAELREQYEAVRAQLGQLQAVHEELQREAEAARRKLQEAAAAAARQLQGAAGERAELEERLGRSDAEVEVLRRQLRELQGQVKAEGGADGGEVLKLKVRESSRWQWARESVGRGVVVDWMERQLQGAARAGQS